MIQRIKFNGYYKTQNIYDCKEEVTVEVQHSAYLSLFGILNEDQKLASRMSEVLQYPSISP